MTSNSETALQTLDELQHIALGIDELRATAERKLDSILPLVIGRRVHRYDHNWMITQASISLDGHVTCYGVRWRNGKAGTRGYYIGRLSLCEPYEGP